MNWLWLLLPLALIVLAVMAYKITTPTFLIDLAAAAFNAALPTLLKTSPHSKEYWDIKHQLMNTPGKDERERLEWALKDVLAKEAKGQLPLQ